MELTRLVFDIAHWTVTCDKKEAIRLVEKVGFSLPQLAINMCDKSIARTVLKNGHFPELMMERIVQTPTRLGLYESWGITMPAKA